MLAHAVAAVCVAAILAPFSYYAGQTARLLRLPVITGYLISGIICGPYLLGILSAESVVDLNIIESACLAVIGLAAGAELDLPSLTRSRKQVLGITAGVSIVTWLLCYLVLDWVELSYLAVESKDVVKQAAMASLGATLMMTRSPASAIAVLKEVDARGPFSSLVMSVVVVKDVAVITCFALNVEAAKVMLQPGPNQGIRLLNITLPFLSVLLSLAIGVFGGLVLSMVLRLRSSATSAVVPAASSTGPAGFIAAGPADAAGVSRTKMAAVLVLSTLVFQVAHFFEAEALLACVAMGMVVVNRRHDRADKDREELHALVAQIMSFTNVAFFGLAGASLKLSALKDMAIPAILVVIARVVAIYIGSWLGCYTTGAHPEWRRLFWASMITQAGVAMGLARLAGTQLPEWGLQFQTFMMAIILINLLMGPPLFRWALVRVGEVRVGPGLPSHGGHAVPMIGLASKATSDGIGSERLSAE